MSGRGRGRGDAKTAPPAKPKINTPPPLFPPISLPTHHETSSKNEKALRRESLVRSTFRNSPWKVTFQQPKKGII